MENKIKVLLLALIGLAGCANAAALQLARDTAKTVDIYQQQVDSKANAERVYYSVQYENLRGRLFGCSSCKPPIKTEDSLYYQSLIVSAQRDAIVTSATLMSAQTSELPKEVITYQGQGNEWESKLRQDLLTRQLGLESNLVVGLKKIDEQSEQLDRVRRQVVTLSTNPGPREELKMLFDLGNGIRTIIQQGATK